MADLTQQVVVQLILDDSQLTPALEQLESAGVIDAKLAGAFKQTTAEINKQAQAIKASAESATPLKKNLEDISKQVKNTASEFIKGFQEGVTDTLKEAGVSIIQLKKSLGTFNQGSPFEKLNKSLSDTSKRVLDAAARLEQLRRTGGAGTEAFVKLEQQLAKDQQELRKLSEEFAKVKQATDVFKDSENGAGDASDSLRQRLKNLTDQIAILKERGEDNTDQFKALVIEAGRVKDAMGDAAAEIRNLASDTGTFDGIISGVQGMTGAFAVGQGVVGLFGEESEELQKTLLRVNSVMAILQGLQQVQNVLQKESAASRLLDTIAAKGQIAVQQLYTFVTGRATAATVAFKVALASTGIGLLVIGVLALVQALNEEDDALERVNNELERNKELLEADTNLIQRRTELEIAHAEAAGKAESEVVRIRSVSLRLQRDALRRANSDLIEQQRTVNKSSEAFFKLNDAIDANNDAIKDIDTKILIEDLNLQKQLTDEAKKSADEAKKAAEERAAKAREARLRELNDQLALLERQLLVAEEGGEEELRIKQRIVAAKARIELAGESLTQNQRKLIQEKSIKEQLELERDRNKRLTAEAIAGQISLNNAVLAQVKTNDDDRLLLQISNIELAAQLEIDAANNNANKIKEIIAKRDGEIAALRKGFIEKQAEDEIALIQAVEGANNRSLQREAADEKKSVRDRIIALQQLANFDLNILDRREKALEDQLAKGLISEEEYNLRYAQLQDEKAKISEETEKKITGLHKGEAEKRKQINAELIQSAIEVSQQVVDILGQLADIQTQRDEQRLEGERAKVQELLESGAITEKEAIARNKRIDAEEKKLKRESAQRDKNIAIFNAVINTAAAVTKALPNLILAGIAAALGAAQIAIIAARPVPKFKGGKKNRYEGPGVIGEAGSEIFEHDGKRYIAHKETLVWLGKDDKVYTPAETKRMLPSVDRQLMKSQNGQTVVANDIDYDALGKAVGKHVKIPGITIDENGFKAWQEQGLSRTNYMNKYYSSPK